MPNSSSSKSSSVSCSFKSSRCPSPSTTLPSASGAADSIVSLSGENAPAASFHPLVHTPPPMRTERRIPSRSNSTASLLSPFASLTRRLGGKHKSSKSGSNRSTPNPFQGSAGMGPSSRMSTPADFPPPPSLPCAPQPSRSTTPAQMSIYSTFPRIHSSPSPSAPSPSQTPFISQLLSGGVQTPTGSSHTCPSPSSSSSQRLSAAGMPVPMELTEVLDEPVEEEGGERVTWEYHHVTLNRVTGYGFGIAVSGGRDNPHFANGDPSIAISDVIKGGPAEGKLQINDRVMSVNGISLENVDYGTAVQVLRDSGAVVNLIVKRRIVAPPTMEPLTYRVTLTKSKKKDDFGVVLGSRLYLKELTNRALIDREASGGSPVFQEGDIILKINSTPTDGLSLKEAKKLIDSCKDKLQLTVRRDTGAGFPFPGSAGGGALGMGAVGLGHHGGPGRSSDPNVFDPSSAYSKDVLPNHSGGHFSNYSENRPNYSNQNLYVQPPTRGGSIDYRNPMTPQSPLPHAPSGSYDDKSNLSRMTGRSRGPLMDVSLSQLDQAANGHDEEAPPRPPPPRPEDYYASRRPADDVVKPSTLEPRFISFQKEGSVGIRVTGGNEVGIFVTAVQPGSPAALEGLVPGDRILKVNDMEMNGVTREEAVLFLLSLQDQIELVVQHKKEEYDQVVAAGHGDSFYVKTHFNYEQPAAGHMAFRKGEVLHVVDTLYKGVVGAWQAFRVGPNGQDLQQGVIPNSAAAEELATAQFNAAKKEATTAASESRGSFFRRRRATHRRSKSLGRDHWDDVVFAETISKFPAYERVVLRHPGFIRPVVFFGPVADLAREKLVKDFPDKFSCPQSDGNRDTSEASTVSAVGAGSSTGRSGIVRLSSIRELVEKGRHALLDITPSAVDKLNYAQFYPVVIFLRADSKHTVKELRAGIPKTAHRSSKKLYEQCVKLEKLWSHIFTTVVPLTQRDTWYRKLREAIDREQNQAIWISETKLDEYLSDDFLFPMTSRLSYASSPESDTDLSPEPRSTSSGLAPPNGGSKSPPSPSGRLIKSSSDPSIATQDDLGMGMSLSMVATGGPVPKFLASPHSKASPRAVSTMDASSTKRRSQGGDSKYGFSAPGSGHSNGNANLQREAQVSQSPRSHFSAGSSASSSRPGYAYSPSSRNQGAGGPNGNYNHNGMSPHLQQHRVNPANSGSYPHHYSPLAYSPSQGYQAHSSSMPGAPELPPKVDRSSKPSRAPRSAQERLFGSREGDFGDGVAKNGRDEPDTLYPSPPPPAPPNGSHSAQIDSSQNYVGSLRGSSSLDRERAAAKAGSYDSSSSYESYNRLGLTLSLAGGPNQGAITGLSDPSGTAMPPGSPSGGASKAHDPYRYTRSTSQPVRSPTEPTSPSKYRPYESNKPSPPPKTSAYKPVPPPKPKNYRPPPNVQSSSSSSQQPQSGPSSNYWNHSPPGTLNPHLAPPPPPTDGIGQTKQNYYTHLPASNSNVHNGHYRYDDADGNGGFDSGHGSSLDRHSYGGGPVSHHNSKAPPPPPPANGGHGSSSRNKQAGQYYYNIPPPRDHHQQQPSQQFRDGNRLDLAQHRDQRGSAFELYRPYNGTRNLSVQETH